MNMKPSPIEVKKTVRGKESFRAIFSPAMDKGRIINKSVKKRTMNKSSPSTETACILKVITP